MSPPCLQAKLEWYEWMASAQAQMRDVALAQVGTRTVTLASPDTKAREKWAPGTRIRACARITCSQTLNTGTGPAWLQAKELSDDTAGLLGRAAEFQQAEARLPWNFRFRFFSAFHPDARRQFYCGCEPHSAVHSTERTSLLTPLGCRRPTSRSICCRAA